MSEVTTAVRQVYYAEAIREALAEEMRRDPHVVLFGEDIALYGGAFGVTRGLLEEFGPERVVNTPIAEGGFTGLAIGAALTGLRPVVEYMFMDFITLAVDQIVNHAAKFRAVYGAQATVPIVFRAAAGAGRCYGATHSQMLEGWFMHVPGLKVIAPATAEDAKGLLISAIRDDDPVLVVEHKDLYKVRMPLPEGVGPIPLGTARLLRAGDDVTLLAYSKAVHTAALAAVALAQEGISAEVVDLRTIKPLDLETVVQSVRKTGRVVGVTEAYKTQSVISELFTLINETAFDWLDAPMVRVAALDVPVPMAETLEDAAIPSAARIIEGVREVLR